MAMKSKSGLQSVVFGVTKGTLIVGDAGTDLADDSWFMIDSVAATGSELPFADEDVVIGRVFKTGLTAAAITPAVGDNVYPLTFTKVCKTDASISTEKGTLDVTDDCEAGYNAYITDGYSDISGSLNGFLKFDDGTGDLGATQEAWLNKFFDIQTDDEPGFHIPYLYNYAGAPWKTQRRVRDLMRIWFDDDPLGICGDEDGGAMSAWYVLSAMGFYPVCPGRPIYDIASPIFERIEIHPKGGKTFTIVAEDASATNKYIQSATLDGKPLNRAWFTHDSIANGGTLTLEMGPRPNKKWGSRSESAPPSMSRESIR